MQHASGANVYGNGTQCRIQARLVPTARLKRAENDQCIEAVRKAS